MSYLWKSINDFALSHCFEFYAACTYTDCFHMFFHFIHSKPLPTILTIYEWMNEKKTLNWMNRVSKKNNFLHYFKSRQWKRSKPPQDIFTTVSVSFKSNTLQIKQIIEYELFVELNCHAFTCIYSSHSRWHRWVLIAYPFWWMKMLVHAFNYFISYQHSHTPLLLFMMQPHCNCKWC